MERIGKKGHMWLAAKRKKGEALQGTSLPLGPREPTAEPQGADDTLPGWGEVWPGPGKG